MQSAPQSSAIDLTRSDPAPSNGQTNDASERSRRRAEPQLQDGRFGFASKEDQMEVDTEEPAAAPRGLENRSERRDIYNDNRYGRGHQRYNAPARDYGYYDRGWGGGRPSRYNEGQYSQYSSRVYR